MSTYMKRGEHIGFSGRGRYGAIGMRSRRNQFQPCPLMELPLPPPPRQYTYPCIARPMRPLYRMRMSSHFPRGRGYPPMGRGSSGMMPSCIPHPIDMGGPSPHGMYPGRPRMRLPPPPMHWSGNLRMMHFRGRGFPTRPFRGKQRPKASTTQSVSSPISSELKKPWVTEAVSNEILKKHKFYQKAKRGKSKDEWEAFKEQRNKVTTMLREAKIEYLEANPDEKVNDASTQNTAKAETLQEGDDSLNITEGNEPKDETPTMGDNDKNSKDHTVTEDLAVVNL